MAKAKTETLNIYFTPHSFQADEPASDSNEVILQWAARLKENRINTLYDLAFQGEADWHSPALSYLIRFAADFLNTVSQYPGIELDRDQMVVELTTEKIELAAREIPFAVGMEYIDETWLKNLWENLSEIFRSQIRLYEGSVTQYFTDRQAHFQVVGRVFFHLVEQTDPEYPFAFLATYSTKPERSKRAVHTPLKNALGEFEGDDQKLLALIRSVIQAAEKSSLISSLMDSGELFRPLKFSTEEAYQFLKELPLYEEAGIMCRIPDWWRRKRNKFQVQIKLGKDAPSKVGMDAILDFTPELCLGDDSVSADELRQFLSMAQGLVQYKGKWIEVDRSKIEAILQYMGQMEQKKGEQLTFAEAIQLELDLRRILPDQNDDVTVSISHGDWMKELITQLTHPGMLAPEGIPDTVHAQLRPYQEIGFRWLHQLYKLKLGACLADDMGLGKTIQIIAFLEEIRQSSMGPVLLILPASLIGNWQKELERFAPELPYKILHRSESKETEIKLEAGHFLYITTYQMAVRLTELHEETWECLILDEAQAIKNPGTKQTKAIKAIPARHRLALTGTPIENRLSDLWSLFDFLNPGMLGSMKEFTAFSKKLATDMDGYGRLRQIIQPFLLRRLKTDRTIISDLPDKIEIRDYTTLSKRQIGLYQQLLKELEQGLSQAEGIQRKGIVLSSLVKFKQICNHPDHYLGKDDYKPDYSGKFESLREICETIYEKRERVLVFTQFQEMTAPLSEFLAEIFGGQGLILHGGTPVQQRKKLVDQFNGEQYVPYMVLSLKAGGVGLNLTAANHVVHFDRWWNPAVENQATDRAYRIGQEKNVMVHKFITRGTIEEKIDELIQSKIKLSGDILSDVGEQWITEYSNKELLHLFALGGEQA